MKWIVEDLLSQVVLSSKLIISILFIVLICLGHVFFNCLGITAHGGQISAVQFSSALQCK